MRQALLEMRQDARGVAQGSGPGYCLKSDKTVPKWDNPSQVDSHKPMEIVVESTAVLRKCKYAFLTLPNYSLIAVSNALEPLRMANRLVGRDVYEWSIVTLDGQAVPSSSGLSLTPAVPLDKLGPVDVLFVCGGVNVREAVSPPLLSRLRRLAERRVPPGRAVHGRLCARARRAAG